MSDSSTIFSGTSRYSSDLQKIIDRAVAIASLPITQLSTEKAALQTESTALATLDEKFTALQSAIASLQAGTGSSSYSVAVSNGSALSASLGAEAIEATYTVQITSLGSYASTMSKDGFTTVTDPSTQNISAGSSFTLTLDGTPHTITPAATTLNSLVEALNDSGLDIQASIVNIGTTASPDYRLSVQGSKLKPMTISLQDGAVELLDTLPGGAYATYKVNGMTTAVESESQTVTLSPGVTLTLLSDTAGSAIVTVSRTTSAISNALTSFVTSYNAAVDALDTHRGSAGGALAGQSIVFTLSQALRDVAQYSAGSGTITSLTDLGLVFDDKGKLSFDTATFAASTGSMDALLAFLGSATEGGFLESASAILDSLEDSTSGAIKTTIASVSSQIDSYTDQIAAAQDRIDQYQISLIEQMSKADALIAALEQKATYMNGLFESMRIAAQMYQ